MYSIMKTIKQAKRSLDAYYKSLSRKHIVISLTSFINRNVRTDSRVLLIGAGGVIEDLVRAEIPVGASVTTMDIDSSLSPDIVSDLATFSSDEQYDVVICSEVLEHVLDSDAAFDNLLSLEFDAVYMSSPFLFPIHLAPFDYRRFTHHYYSKKLEGENYTIYSRGGAVFSLYMLLCRLHAEAFIPWKIIGYISLILGPLVRFSNLVEVDGIRYSNGYVIEVVR